MIKIWNNYHYDRVILLTVSLLLGFGLLMVASASMVISGKYYDQPLHFFWHQLAYVVVALICSAFIMHVPSEKWKEMSPLWLLISAGLLIAVLIPGIGRQVNGSTRWIHLGIISLQVSEIAKFGVILYMAGYLTRHAIEVRKNIMGFIKPMIVLGVLSILLLLEPDFGATTVMVLTALGMMFMAQVRLRHYLLLILLVAVALAGLAFTSPYRLARLTTFLNPWANAFDSGYQLTQSLIAFGRGGIFGVGLGNSMQKLFYLPEAHTDFLFAVLAEELGLIGELAIIVLFALFVWRGLLIGYRAHKEGAVFQAYVAYGISLCFALQTMINIGVNTGLLPTKGLTLPFMSYGGSSIVISCMMVAVLLRISSDLNRGLK